MNAPVVASSLLWALAASTPTPAAPPRPPGPQFNDRRVIAAECGGRSVTISGTQEADEIVGTDGDDVIHGLGGKDLIRAGRGNDVVCGGEGDDDIWLDDGTDTAYGGDGGDIIHGGSDRDVIHGEMGPDHVFGEGGGDVLYGDEVFLDFLRIVAGHHGDTLHFAFLAALRFLRCIPRFLTDEVFDLSPENFIEGDGRFFGEA